MIRQARKICRQKYHPSSLGKIQIQSIGRGDMTCMRVLDPAKKSHSDTHAYNVAGSASILSEPIEAYSCGSYRRNGCMNGVRLHEMAMWCGAGVWGPALCALQRREHC